MPAPSSNPNPIPNTPPAPARSQAAAATSTERRPLLGRRARLHALPVADARPPTTTACLKCQLVGSRRLTCSKAAACAELPHSYALGPILLALWLGTAIAFVVAVYGR